MRRPRLRLAVPLLVLFLGLAPGAHAAVTVPAGFVDEEVARVQQPTAIAFTPAKKMFVTERTGKLWATRSDGTSNKVLALDLTQVICTNGERGLLGLTFDPDFNTNRYLYLYYTRKQFDCGPSHSSGAVNRVSRFTLNTNNVVVPGSEVVLIPTIPNRGTIHNAGDLEFGKDKTLFVSSGDAGCHWQSGVCGSSQTSARELNNLNGKILRINRDGSVPADNPYAGQAICKNGPSAAGTRCAEIYAHGLRNPFRMAFDPNGASTRFFINDVGATKWEEVNEGQKGADYGWNVREGHCLLDSYTNCPAPPASMTNPLHDYAHTTGCASIVGGAFIPGGRGWPSSYTGAYLFSDYTCGKMWRLEPKAGGGYTAQVFASGSAASAVHFEWGPMPTTGEALYYSTFDSYGVIRRIRYVGAVNRPPTAALDADPMSGELPLPVSFDASGSSDPDQDALTYEWNSGDGSPAETTSTPTIDHTYTEVGVYEAQLIVRDDEGLASDPVKVKIQAGNSPPSITITAPPATQKFAVGEALGMRATASDPEDGQLPGSAITWEAVRWHGSGLPSAHTHPYFGPVTGDAVTITGPPPEDLASTRNSYLEVRATAEDSQGLTHTVTRRINPRYTEIQFDSLPKGAEFTAGGVRFVAPKIFTTWPGYRIFASPPATWTSTSNGLRLTHNFVIWEDGVTQRERTITSPYVQSYWRARYSSVLTP